MDTIAMRIEEVRKERGLSKTDIWKGAGLSSGAYSHWMNGGTLLGENLIKVAQILNVNPVWLETGRGQKEPGLQNIAGYQEVNKNNLHPVPVVGRGMGGLPDRMFTDEGRPTNGHDDYADVYSTDPSAFLVKVEGNSMWPKYSQGDYALIEPGTEPEIEDDVLLRTNKGEVMLKRLLSKRSGYLFGSYNESDTYSFDMQDIVWMYYVAYPVPAKKIKSRV
jgi:phage repressor protein C with HTH and peptisase S24 domain